MTYRVGNGIAAVALASLLMVTADATASEAPARDARANHLHGQTSPYLLQHLYNPVDWYPWGEEALTRARELDRPIFLSIGYSACHWCHVMEREAFSNQGIARILNERFVPVKVDREERPDLDSIYMTAVQSMTGRGGWPMSVFLTPDLLPFFGGTYFPEERFRQVLLAIADTWGGRRAEIVESARRIHAVIRSHQRVVNPGVGFDPETDLLTRASANLEASYDSRHGGFGSAPKFPPHGAIHVLLERHRRDGDPRSLEMAVETLDAMARGGMYDQIGGGFHRYSTDEQWLVPHFEKMLYDNALLVPVYLQAWQQTGRADFKRTAEEILDWVAREMTDRSGGFYSSLDADSDGEEGIFYLWTVQEVRGLLDAETAALVIDRFGMNEAGDFEGGRNVPHLPVPLKEFARERGLETGETRRRLDAARRTLLEARDRRVRPRRDDKVLTAWNGLAITAYAKAYAATGRESYRRIAEKAARFVLDELTTDRGALLVTWRHGKASLPAYLDDHAFLARGLLDLHEATSDPVWLDEAKRIVRRADAFYDDEQGGYFFTSEGHRRLIIRTKTLYDSALPSGNAIMVENLLRLSRAGEEHSVPARAERTLSLLSSQLDNPSRSSAYLVLAATRLQPGPPPRPLREVAGSPAVALASVARAAPSPPDDPEPAGADTVVKGRVVGRGNVQRVVETALSAPARPVRPNQAVTLSLALDIKDGWHVNSSRPTLKYLIPTSVEFPEPVSAVVEEIVYPEGHMVGLKFADEKLSVYEGRTIIRATIRPSEEGGIGRREISSRVTYQACSDTACLPPETQEFAIALLVEGEPVEMPSPRPGGSMTSTVSTPAGSAALGGSRENLAVLLEQSGLLTLLIMIFGWGLALNLTPCIYPMIPVTIGFFASQSERGWGRRVGLPSLYVLGMALTYSILGTVAGLTGGLFGATLQSPWVIGALVLLFVAMALSMFGLFEFRMPSFLMRVGGGRKGYIGAFLMGMTVGLVAAPCIGPFIVALLAFVGASGNPVLGFWLFFVLAIGLGLPSLVLGVFSGTVASLPRSGVWLIYAKKVMGVALLAVAIYFLQPFLTDRQVGWIAIAFAAGSAFYLALLERSKITGTPFIATRLIIGAAVFAGGIWVAAPLVSAHPEADWGVYSDVALERARAEGRPVVIDFYADWCLPCKELDRNTFSDPRVIDATGRFTLLKVDLTSFESDSVRRLRERFDVIGVPTIVFIDGQGIKRPDLRLDGFEKPGQFLERLKQVR